MDTMQPGQVIAPQSTDEPPKEPVQPNPGAPEPERPEQAPGEDGEPALPPKRPAEPAKSAGLDEPTFAYTRSSIREPQYAPHQENVSSDPIPRPLEDISWTASEFIEHQKGAKWYLGLVVTGLAGAGLCYVATKDMITTGVILFATVVFGAFANRKPRTQQYALTRQGLQIGGKVYYFDDFKNFSIAAEGAIASIVFMPLKRFMPPLTIYVSPDMEDRVIGFLSEVLPFEQHQADAVDSLMRKIRF